MDGGRGDDTLDGGQGSDDLDGGPGTDHVLGDSGNDSLTGGAGDADRVDGGLGDEPMVSGGPGDFDVVEGGPGVDRIDGGPGEHDIASYSSSTSPIHVDLAAGTMHGAESERLTAIEDVLGGSGEDTLDGSAAANRLDGGQGDDWLYAQGPGDAAFGGPGADDCLGDFQSRSSCSASSSEEVVVPMFTGPWYPGEPLPPALAGPQDPPDPGTIVELVASIDGSTSLTITGSPGDDDVVAERSGDSYVVTGGRGTHVSAGPPGEASCSTDPTVNRVTCNGKASRVSAKMGGGDDTLVLHGFPVSVSAVLDGEYGSDDLSGGPGADTLYGGEDRGDPDVLHGGGGSDALFGLNTAHPQKDSGAAQMYGEGGSDLLIGGQPCDGDLFDGGGGNNDSASFARIRNSGTAVKAEIGGAVTDPDTGGGCTAGHIDSSVEKIEGSPGPDILSGDNGPNDLLGRGGDDRLDGKGGYDKCVGGGGHDSAHNCEQAFSVP